jgi:hypothetical protein
VILKQVFGGPGAAGTNIRVALADLRPDVGVAQFQVIFKLIGVHDADDGDAILLQDEVFMVEVGALGQLAEVDASFGDGETIDHTDGWFSQGEVLAYLISVD